MPQPPPDGLPVYRLLTGSDDDAFCRRVSEALQLGYQLYGSPAVASDRDRVTVVNRVSALRPAGLPAVGDVRIGVRRSLAVLVGILGGCG
jgi:hypothetical protein